jgi:cyclase
LLAKRIIPHFLLKGKRLVKGTNFEGFVDVGDPVSQAMIYDAQGADEIVIVDIDASKEGRIIDTNIIDQILKQCRLPIGAGGGIRTIEDARRCFGAGADKIILNTQAVLNPAFVSELAAEFGSQSIVVSLDVRRNGADNYNLYIYSGEQMIDIMPHDIIKKLVDYGAGEFIITTIDREGTLKGFDCGLYSSLRESINVPLIASGGAGSYDDIANLFEKTDSDACAIGKMLFLRDYDIVRIKSYLKSKKVLTRVA